jgi:hypothetical protein
LIKDQDLIELIEQLREPATLSFQYAHVPQHNRPSGVSSTWDVAEPLKKAMNSHPEFADSFGRIFLGKQLSFSNQYQAMNVLRVALRSGAVEALAWYRRVLATKRAKMRVVAEVYGLWVQERHTFSNGVTLLPVSELPDSPNSMSLKQPDIFRLGIQFPTAVMVELNDVENEASEIGHNRFLEISETMRKTVTAFALSGDAAPTMAVSWQEFVDLELQEAEFGRTWMSSSHEGRFPNHSANVTSEIIDWVEKYLRLPPEVTRVCDVPLSRLNLARRRVTPGDKAIDGSVCLEALLSGRARGEMTHKLSVRAALLLGRSLDERQKIAEKVRKFYALRSDVVHGGADAKANTNHQTAQE